METQNMIQPSNAEPQDPYQRLRELLAVPDRDRNDAIWDEINLLEIEMAFKKREMSSQAIPLNSQIQTHRPSSTTTRKPEKRFFKKQRTRSRG
jgi:hypothetical protein